jgi:Retrotransposon gag protein
VKQLDQLHRGKLESQRLSAYDKWAEEERGRATAFQQQAERKALQEAELKKLLKEKATRASKQPKMESTKGSPTKVKAEIRKTPSKTYPDPDDSSSSSGSSDSDPWDHSDDEPEHPADKPNDDNRSSGESSTSEDSDSSGRRSSHHHRRRHRHHSPDYDRIQVPSPGKFNTTKASVDNWLFTMNNYFNVKDFPRKKRVTYAVLLLKGHALTWWKSLCKKGIQTNSWTKFQQDITHQFRRFDAEQLAREKLWNIHQTTSVQDYIAKFTDITCQITDITEAEACDRFKRGLKTHIQVQLMRQQTPNNLILLQEAALREDGISFKASRMTKQADQ